MGQPNPVTFPHLQTLRMLIKDGPAGAIGSAHTPSANLGVRPPSGFSPATIRQCDAHRCGGERGAASEICIQILIVSTRAPLISSGRGRGATALPFEHAPLL